MHLTPPAKAALITEVYWKRYTSTDIVQNEDGTSSGLTPSQYFAQNDITTGYAHIGNYYYWYIHPNGVCGSSQSSQNIQTQTDSGFQAIVLTLQAGTDTVTS
jgi:hypothetical protein